MLCHVDGRSDREGLGFLEDPRALHHPRICSQPYKTESFNASQTYRFHCPVCMAPEEWQALDHHTITRAVDQDANSVWYYSCSKAVLTGYLKPLP